MSVMIRKLSANTQGKDYVVGDLHGCFSLLERLLRQVNFDPHQDRLFSVGDLIDRGPESLRCLHLLAKPWFYAVKGNHELMMQSFFLPYLQNGYLDNLDDSNNSGFLDYGGKWIEAYFQADRHAMSEEFNHGLSMILQLPLIWVIGNGQARFHIIHAELVNFNKLHSELTVWLDNDIDQWLATDKIPHAAKESLYWGRTLMLHHYAELSAVKVQEGLSPVFCGHSYAPELRQALSHICIDTGAFKTLEVGEEHYALTLFDIKAGFGYWASYQRNTIICEDFPLGI